MADALYKQVKSRKELMPLVYATTVHKRRHKKINGCCSILGIKLEALADSTGKYLILKCFLYG